MAALEFLNMSEMEKDPFEDFEKSYEDYDYNFLSSTSLWIYLIVMFVLMLIISLCVVSADIFLICVICKFKKLRIRTNVYIVNCSIVNIYLYLHMPLNSLIFNLMLNIRGSYIIDTESETAAIILYFILTFALALDWFLSSYRSSINTFYNKYYLFFIIGFNLTFVLGWFIKVVIYFIYQYNESIYFDLLHTHLIYKIGVYAIILIGILILNILKKILTLPVASIKNCYALTTANTITFSYLPLLIFHILGEIFDGHIFFAYILLWTERIPEFIADIHPIIVVYMLGRQSKHFKMAYLRCFKRSLKDYTSPNLNDDSDEESELENNLSNEISLNEDRDQQQQTIMVL